MRYAGIDIGSTTIELVVVENGDVIQSKMCDSGFDPLKQSQKLIDGIAFDKLIATGYGRHLLEIYENTPTITEIKACAKGVNKLYPQARSIIDIGGQDCKVINLDENGKVRKFEMNDRCAAGTGKFLDIMSKTLGYSIDEFGIEASKGTEVINISSMCTVFGESEVVSLLSRGVDRQNIALGLHKSVVNRVLSMLKRISAQEPMVFVGGVAKNPCISKLFSESLGKNVIVPEKPQFVSALGAAIMASLTDMK
jgi:(R)-2-hydroxyacyl-CoA dehydratese activating ATPase